MKTSAQAGNLPFLYRFAKPIPADPSSPLRYDRTRQITQVLQNGQWIDTPDAPDETVGVSRKTAVQQETTDDE
jgi:hypothetical protein